MSIYIGLRKKLSRKDEHVSSTNRSDARKEHVADYYVTPAHEIELFLKELEKEESLILLGNILDPCSGGLSGLIGEEGMSYPLAIEKIAMRNMVSPSIETIDIRENSQANIKADYLNINCKGKYDLIISNPPFNQALSFIEKAIDDVKDGGFVIFLLRLNFFGSVKRKGLWERFMPKFVFVHHRRMSFTNDGRKDSIEYAHFVWKKGYNPKFTKLLVI